MVLTGIAIQRKIDQNVDKTNRAVIPCSASLVAMMVTDENSSKEGSLLYINLNITCFALSDNNAD